MKWRARGPEFDPSPRALSASISAGKSFSPGMSRVVISNQTLVSCLRYSSVSRTGASLPSRGSYKSPPEKPLRSMLAASMCRKNSIRGFGGISRAYGNGLNSPLATSLCHIDCIFEKNHGIVVGKGDRPASASHCRFCDLLWRGRILNTIKIPGFGDVPVLAEFAGQVAAGCAEGQNWRARQEVIERLLLDRVDAKTR